MATTASDRLIEAMPWLDDAAHGLRAWFAPVFGQEAPRGPRDALYAVWLGHPLHPAVATLPIGFWSSTMVLDLVGEERAADLSLNLGLVTALGAAASGAAQWQDAGVERKTLRLGALHAGLNIAATALFAGSSLMRRGGNRGAGIALSTVGLGISGFSAWLGGELVYVLGVGVDRNAYPQPPVEWTDVLADEELVEGTPRRVVTGEVPVLLVRRGGTISAIAATCGHLGGPLDEGTIEADTVTCPWHASVFCLADGKVKHGPATAAQPAFEVRRQAGRIAIRPQRPNPLVRPE